MQKEIQEKWVLFSKHTLNSPMDIGVYASQDEPNLRALATQHGLKVTGPLEHAYWDMAVQGAPHILEIWLPVEARAKDQKMEGLKHVSEYKCLTAAFNRSIEEIGDAWMELGEKAKKYGHQLTNHDREVYRIMDCDHPGNNDIELQLGIK
jgi:effector-binding domain-containing protein